MSRNYKSWRAFVVSAMLLPLLVQASPGSGEFYFVAGSALIYPDLDYDDPTVTLDGQIPVLGRLVKGNEIPIPGTAIDIPDISLIGGSLGYQIADRFAVEVVAGVPGAIDFVGGGVLAPLGNFAEFKTGKFIPLLFNMLYRPFPDKAVRPYVGAGPALAWIREADVTNPLVEDALSLEFPEVNWGWGVQAGAQLDVTDRWFMRLDAKYLRVYVDEINLHVSAVGQSLEIDISNGEMDLPLLSFGIGRAF